MGQTAALEARPHIVRLECPPTGREDEAPNGEQRGGTGDAPSGDGAASSNSGRVLSKMRCFLEGRTIEDVCEINRTSRPLGTGSFATVWKGRLKESGCIVAVKQMDKEKLRRMKVSLSTVMNEVELMRECEGKDCFLRCYDFVDCSRAYFIIVEFCNGGNLQDAAMAGEAHLNEVQVRPLMKQMLNAIMFMHAKHICHRDVKPHNFLVSGRLTGDDGMVKLADFGIAVRFEPGKLMKDQVGTPAFMAPEIHLLPRKSPGYDCKVDIWAVGVVMVFLLAAEYPWVDSAGRLLRDQLVRGNLPLWDTSVFTGLFNAFQEVAGMRRKSPSRVAQELIRECINPRCDRRISAEAALGHKWFTAPIEQGGARANDEPLLRWEDFEESLSVLEKHTSWAVDVLAALPVSAVEEPFHIDPGDDRVLNCVVCYGTTGNLGYMCPQCRYAVCLSCLQRLPKPMCPHCRHEAKDLALTQAFMRLTSRAAEEMDKMDKKLKAGAAALDLSRVVVDVNVPRRLSAEDEQRKQNCLSCARPSTATSYSCPACCASMCYECTSRELATSVRCAACGEEELNREALRDYLAAAQALSAASSVGTTVTRSFKSGVVSVLGEDAMNDPAAAITKTVEPFSRLGQSTMEPISQHVEAAARRVRTMSDKVSAATKEAENWATLPESTALMTQRGTMCAMCDKENSWTDFVCPTCSTCVCKECICLKLAENPHCPHCKDSSNNIHGMRFILKATRASHLLGNLWKLGGELLLGDGPVATPSPAVGASGSTEVAATATVPQEAPAAAPALVEQRDGTRCANKPITQSRFDVAAVQPSEPPVEVQASALSAREIENQTDVKTAVSAHAKSPFHLGSCEDEIDGVDFDERPNGPPSSDRVFRSGSLDYPQQRSRPWLGC
eukprot:TRINITY_DN60761_c0_g1_i1.p1 TRINITY_DN60761_c0_g1~~TRINITY_DN60761_c0_g1_i1.p1  ORF type:complete len:896 (-),score=132.68 TRINITY_DN60761_c0_g1_i1:500-3187(-)